MRYSVLFHDETRITGEANNFEDIKAKTNALHAVDPIKCVTVFFDDVEGGVFSEKKND